MKENLSTALWILFAAVNLCAYVIMGVDKNRAIRKKRRVPEKVLFAFAICFGGLGGTLGMYSFRHKTKHWYFAVFFPLLALLQIAAVVYFLMV